MRLARAGKCDPSIRFRRQHGRAAAALFHPDTALVPGQPRHTVPDRAALPIASRGHKGARMEMHREESRRAEARHIRLRIDLR